jgi:hypothetical protein
MPKSRSRIVWVTLAVGALTTLGTSGAGAAVTQTTPTESASVPGFDRIPVCESFNSLNGTPLCPHTFPDR